MGSTWTDPADIATQIERLWARGDLLTARLSGDRIFPMSMRLRRPSAADLATRFEEVRAWIRDLDLGSKTARGFGYDVVWREVNHRQIGRNRMPFSIEIATADDAFSLIDRMSEMALFDRLTSTALERMPRVEAWLLRHPLAVLQHADDWLRILDVAGWLMRNPSSGRYIRQIDLAGVDTKFIEARKAIIAEIVDADTPSEPSGTAQTRASAADFERRFGLRVRSPLVRFRILDPVLAIAGLTDLTVPVEEFARLRLDAARVFITENEMNGLAFPELARSVVVFKLGYAVDLLGSIPWLRDRQISYWGDIDTHGFAILDKLRAYLPAARSLLMDREILLDHRQSWGREPHQHPGGLTRLDPAERDLFETLRDNRLGSNVRLEQERIPMSALLRALEATLRQ